MDYNIVKRLFPPKLANHETFSIFVDIASIELSKVFDYISIMTTLSNVDRCPEIFIQHLGELVDFDWSPYLGSEEQRECMKYTWDAHKMKGSKEDLEFMATYGDIDGYQGGRLFVPGCNADTRTTVLEDLIYTEEAEELFIRHASYNAQLEELSIVGASYNSELIETPPEIIKVSPDFIMFGETIWGDSDTFSYAIDDNISEDNESSNNPQEVYDYELILENTVSIKPRAIVSLPREQLFTFNKSEFDGEDYLPDNIVYKEGTILIEVTRINSEIMDKVETVKPAGMLVVYKYVHDGTYEYITHTRTLSEVN